MCTQLRIFIEHFFFTYINIQVQINLLYCPLFIFPKFQIDISLRVEMLQATKIIHIKFLRKIFFFRNFYLNEEDKRSLLFSPLFSPEVLEWYFHYKKSYMVEKKLITWSRGPPRTWS